MVERLPCKVSIVIPLYNAETWIAATLTSVLAQTVDHRLLELIIVDDGSQDQGVACATELLRGTALKHQIICTSNGGPSRARNLGWRAAQGEWIQFLDADDLLAPTKIAHQLAETAHCLDQVAVIYSSWQRLSYRESAWRPWGAIQQPKLGDDLVADLLRSENFLAVGSQLIRRNWLEHVAGFNEKHRLIEDVELFLRMAMAGAIFYEATAAQPLFFYRNHPNSLSKRDQRAFIDGCLRNAELVEQFWRQQDALTPSHKQQLASLYFQGTRYYAAVDQASFAYWYRKITALEPNFLPPGPRMLRILTHLLGYQRAEQIAVQYRRMRKS